MEAEALGRLRQLDRVRRRLRPPVAERQAEPHVRRHVLPAGKRNDFRLEELFEALHAAFAPLATLAVATERPARMNEHAEVDRDRAGADPSRERERAILVLRPDA